MKILKMIVLKYLNIIIFQLSEELRKKRAENEKNKGNEAVKSKDFKEAL